MCSIRQLQPMKFLLVLLAISAVYCLEGEKTARGAIECHSHADCNTRELCDHGHCVERFAGRSHAQEFECDSFDDCFGGICVNGRCSPSLDENSHEKLDAAQSSDEKVGCKTTDDCPDMTACYKGKCVPWHFDENSHEKRDVEKTTPDPDTDQSLCNPPCPMHQIPRQICYKAKCRVFPRLFGEN